MRTNNQAEIIIFKKNGTGFLFLILKRIPERGGFWQPITGGLEDEETFEEAATRETREEIGLTEEIDLINIDYSFNFSYNNNVYLEKVFGLEISSESEIILSEEHTEYKWVDGQTAIDKFLKYPGNKEGFRKLIELINNL
jgi:8-oxo-dGTP pyrophosphatase MutT (NUDIX family)